MRRLESRAKPEVTEQMALTNLWTSGDAAKAMKAEFAGPTDQRIGSVSIDSRTVDNDAIFFAIKGDRFDGHAFVEKRWQKARRLPWLRKTSFLNFPSILLAL